MAATGRREVEDVCPSIEILTKRETAVPCPVEGCSRIFQSSSCLRMHLIKTHGVTKSIEEKTLYIRGQSRSQVQKHFYCPAKFCVRGKDTKRPFSRMSQLKQHYMTVHAEKKNVCSKCGKGFGLPDACRRHESMCGQLFKCSCGCPYTTVQALITHARRQMHSLPDFCCRKKQISTPPVPSTVNLLVAKPSGTFTSKLPPAIFEQNASCYKKWAQPCPILPKPGWLSPTATNEQSSSCSSKVKDVITKAVQTQTPHAMHSIETQTPKALASKDQACNSNTQTSSSHALNQLQFNNSRANSGNFNQTSVGTQVGMLVNQCDLGTGTDNSFLAQLGCFSSSEGSHNFGLNENIPQDTQVSHLPSITSFVTGEGRAGFLPASGNSMHGLTVDPLCFNTQTQTNLTSTDFPLNDFRLLNNTQTQTCTLDLIPLEDNETQTLISILGIDSSNSTDSGTQTQNLFDDLFGSQDIELTESQTQTWFADHAVSPGDLGNSGHDFVDKTLDDLVDIHTQTSLMMSDFGELVDDITFAHSQTQTLQSDLGCANLLSSGVQTDVQWLQMAQPDAEARSGPVAYTSSHTQTQQRFVEEDSLMSSVETQT